MKPEELIKWVGEEYGTVAEHKWFKYPDFAVLRNADGKWYGVIMNVPKSKFGLEGDGDVFVVNVKSDPMWIDMLVEKPGYERAYHMNKDKWISVFLDGSVDDETIKDMLADSYEKTSIKKKKQNRKEK